MGSCTSDLDLQCLSLPHCKVRPTHGFSASALVMFGARSFLAGGVKELCVCHSVFSSVPGLPAARCREQPPSTL